MEGDRNPDATHQKNTTSTPKLKLNPPKPIHNPQKKYNLNPKTKPKTQRKLLENARRMLDEVPLPPIRKFNYLLADLVRMRHYETVISLSKQILQRGPTPDVYTLNILVNCLCKTAKTDSVVGLLLSRRMDKGK
ncbi:hypothetical protein Tsubulata_050706, partial [Turnera subulata]